MRGIGVADAMVFKSQAEAHTPQGRVGAFPRVPQWSHSDPPAHGG
jgi:hypothetical protein